MLIKIYCTDLDEAVSRLQDEIKSGDLQKEIDNTEEGETVYAAWGEIEA